MVKKTDGSEHEPVELTPSVAGRVRRMESRKTASRTLGSGGAKKASHAIASRQDAAAEARAAADRAMGITRR